MRERPGESGEQDVRLGRLAGQVVGHVEEIILRCVAYIIKPVPRHADAQHVVLGKLLEERRQVLLPPDVRRGLGRAGNHDVLDPLAQLDQLRRAGLRMGLDPPPLRPAVSVVVVVDVGEQQAGGEGVGNAELHQLTPNTFITSSPRWLITLTAIRPDCGLSNGRETSLCRLAQACWSISAFSVVFSAL